MKKSQTEEHLNRALQSLPTGEDYRVVRNHVVMAISKMQDTERRQTRKDQSRRQLEELEVKKPTVGMLTDRQAKAAINILDSMISDELAKLSEAPKPKPKPDRMLNG